MALSPNGRELPSVDAIRRALGQKDAVDTGAHMAALMQGMNDFPTDEENARHAEIHARVMATFAAMEDGEEQGPSMPVQGHDAIQDVG